MSKKYVIERTRGRMTRQNIMNAIHELTALKKGRPPTVRELCDATGLKSTNSINYHLDILEGQGLIERDHGKARSVRIKQ